MPNYYYKYNFISPEPLYANVKEELRSYLDTGAIDDTMWNVYTDKCLQKLGRSSYKILEWMLEKEIFDYREVAKVVAMYYSNPVKLLNIMGGQ